MVCKTTTLNHPFVPSAWVPPHQTGNIWDAAYAFRDTQQPKHNTRLSTGQGRTMGIKARAISKRGICELSTTIYGFRPVTAVTLINVLNWAVSTSNCAFEDSFRSTTYVIMYAGIYAAKKIWNSKISKLLPEQ